MEYKIHTSLTSIDGKQWDRLLGPEDPPFAQHAFLSALEETECAVPSTGWHPRFITVHENGEMVGGLPLYRKDHSYGEFIFDYAWADAAHRARLPYFPKLVACIPFSPADGRRFLVAANVDPVQVRRILLQGARAAAEAEPATGVHLLFLSNEEQSQLRSEGLFPRDTLQFHWLNQEYTSFDAYLALLKSKRRAQIRRERRKVVEAGVVIRIVEGVDATEADLDSIWAFYRNTLNQYSWSQRYLNRAFFAAAFEHLKDDIVLVLASKGDQAIAGTFNMVRDGVFYGRYWGCTEEVPFLHFEVCLYTPMELAISRGYRVVQPGAGGQHKIARGFLPKVIRSSHEIYIPRLNEAVEDAVRFENQHTAQVVQASQDWNWKKR